MPRARSRAREPVEMASMFIAFIWSPRRMMEPLPYIFSIWLMAVWMACFLSLAGAAVLAWEDFFSAMFSLLFCMVKFYFSFSASALCSAHRPRA